MRLRRLSPADLDEGAAGLADVLVDCVAGGASVGFLAPLGFDAAERYWRSVGRRLVAGEVEVLVAERDGVILGTGQLIVAQPANGSHRADVAKMLVHRRARRQGAGRALLTALEERASALGRSLLTLDTATGSEAERLYARMGWTEAGRIPGYSILPDGRRCGTTLFFKNVPERRPGAAILTSSAISVSP